jgi:hypothetical protein
LSIQVLITVSRFNSTLSKKRSLHSEEAAIQSHRGDFDPSSRDRTIRAESQLLFQVHDETSKPVMDWLHQEGTFRVADVCLKDRDCRKPYEFFGACFGGRVFGNKFVKKAQETIRNIWVRYSVLRFAM